MGRKNAKTHAVCCFLLFFLVVQWALFNRFGGMVAIFLLYEGSLAAPALASQSAGQVQTDISLLLLNSKRTIPWPTLQDVLLLCGFVGPSMALLVSGVGKWPPYVWKPLTCGYVAAGAFFLR